MDISIHNVQYIIYDEDNQLNIFQCALYYCDEMVFNS